MTRLKTGATKKKNKALARVTRVVLMDIRRQMEQQRKRKAKVSNSSTKKLSLEKETQSAE